MSQPPELPKQKSGTSCFVTGGIGCLVLLVLVFLGGGAFVARQFPELKAKFDEFRKEAKTNPDKAAAKLGLKIVPNIIIVREDDAAKTITWKVSEDGEEMTMHYEGLSSAGKKPRVTNSKGEEVDLTQPPKGETPPPATPPPAPALPAPAPASPQ